MPLELVDDTTGRKIPIQKLPVSSHELNFELSLSIQPTQQLQHNLSTQSQFHEL